MSNEYTKLWKREQAKKFRTCKKCKIKKSLDNFQKHNKNYYRICISCWEIDDNAINGRSSENNHLIKSNKLRCGVCKEIKDLENYRKDKHKKIGYKTICKSCLPIREKAVSLRSNYNLELSDYFKLLKNQEFCCAICKTPIEGITKDKQRQANVDHCHKTGKVRGLLCSNCNRGIGLLKDSKQVLSNALRYLIGSQ